MAPDPLNQTTGADYNPFEPTYKCDRCQDTGRVKIKSLIMPIGRLPDIGTPDAPGRDITFSYEPCRNCNHGC